jgi:hypothetical protein
MGALRILWKRQRSPASRSVLLRTSVDASTRAAFPQPTAMGGYPAETTDTAAALEPPIHALETAEFR